MPMLFRILVVALPTALLGFVFATLGLGLAGFYLAAAVTAPSVVWILAADPARERPSPPGVG